MPRLSGSPSELRPSGDTRLRYSLLTPLAAGGIAVVSIHGEKAEFVLTRICTTATGQPLSEFHHRPLRLVRIVDGDEVIDDAIVACVEGLNGGEFELCLHGGVRVVQRVLMLLERHGVRPASEAPADSVEERIDRLLPLAITRRMARWLLAQRQRLPAYLESLANPSTAPSQSELDAFAARSTVAARLMRGLRVALVGPPNAGKSTLANALIGRDRVIVSDVAGTTRDWVEEQALIGDWPVTLTDTAGIRDTDDQLEALAIARGMAQAQTADLVLHVRDVRAPIEADATAVMGFENVLTVWNKCDLNPSTPATGTSERGDGCRISALTGMGLAELETRIGERLGLDRLTEHEAAVPW